MITVSILLITKINKDVLPIGTLLAAMLFDTLATQISFIIFILE